MTAEKNHVDIYCISFNFCPIAAADLRSTNRCRSVDRHQYRCRIDGSWEPLSMTDHRIELCRAGLLSKKSISLSMFMFDFILVLEHSATFLK